MFKELDKEKVSVVNEKIYNYWTIYESKRNCNKEIIKISKNLWEILKILSFFN